MRFQFGFTLVFCAAAVCAQTVTDPELARARADAEHLRTLVAAGAAPRVELQRAEEKIADAEDAAILRRTLYGPDLTESQNEEMIAAAQRRLDRRKAAVTRERQLVDQGVVSVSSVTPYLEDLDRARKEFDLAESRARLCRELTVMAKAEEEYHSRVERSTLEAHRIAERYDGSGTFTGTDFHRVEAAFEGHFGKTLPVSAMGETAVHRALGFDHRGRVDVAIHPDQPEGVWLLRYLEDHRIPYFAFRQAVPGKATGAHIHIGPMSTRVARTGSGAVSGS